MGIEQKVAVITGASQGMGAALLKACTAVTTTSSRDGALPQRLFPRSGRIADGVHDQR
jgi:NAD(P)-dependent dehydrogenase (short-subunit alcohol dehydrogenase family)